MSTSLGAALRGGFLDAMERAAGVVEVGDDVVSWREVWAEPGCTLWHEGLAGGGAAESMEDEEGEEWWAGLGLD